MTTEYSRERFDIAVGERCAILTGSGPLEMVVDRVSANPGGVGFHVLFRGPHEPVVPQSTYRVRGGTLDDISLFLVPVGSDPIKRVTEYEAVVTTVPAPGSHDMPNAELDGVMASSPRRDVGSPEDAVISWRRFDPNQDTDLDRRIYAATREEEFRHLDWPTEAIEAFVRQQYEAQTTHYREHYHGLEKSIIVVEGIDVGRLLIHRTPQETRVVDIAILPDHRNQGIGTDLLERIIRQSAPVPVGIHVEATNPARRLYERLGFSERETFGMYLYLRTASDLDPGRPIGSSQREAPEPRGE